MIGMILVLASMSGVGQVVVTAPATPLDAERKICRKTDQTGSRLARGRICKTASEWQIEKRDAERILSDRQNLNLEHPVQTAAP